MDKNDKNFNTNSNQKRKKRNYFKTVNLPKSKPIIKKRFYFRISLKHGREKKIIKNKNLTNNSNKSIDTKSSIKVKTSKRKNYKIVNNFIRRMVVSEVLKGKKLKDVAKKYKVNYSTAKTIMRIYRDEKRTSRKPDVKKKIFNISKVTNSKEKNSEKSKMPFINVSFFNSEVSLQKGGKNKAFNIEDLNGNLISNRSSDKSDTFRSDQDLVDLNSLLDLKKINPYSEVKRYSTINEFSINNNQNQRINSNSNSSKRVKKATTKSSKRSIIIQTRNITKKKEFLSPYRVKTTTYLKRKRLNVGKSKGSSNSKKKKKKKVEKTDLTEFLVYPIPMNKNSNNTVNDQSTRNNTVAIISRKFSSSGCSQLIKLNSKVSDDNLTRINESYEIENYDGENNFFINEGNDYHFDLKFPLTYSSNLPRTLIDENGVAINAIFKCKKPNEISEIPLLLNELISNDKNCLNSAVTQSPNIANELLLDNIPAYIKNNYFLKNLKQIINPEDLNQDNITFLNGLNSFLLTQKINDEFFLNGFYSINNTSFEVLLELFNIIDKSNLNYDSKIRLIDNFNDFENCMLLYWKNSNQYCEESNKKLSILLKKMNKQINSIEFNKESTINK